jgi:hypothetical protein
MSDWRSEPRKKRNKIWSVSRDELWNVVLNSSVLSAALKHFGMDPSSGNYRILKERLRIENIDYTHIPLGLSCNKDRPPRHKTKQPTLDEVLVEHSTYSRKSLKNRLLKEGLLIEKCYECGIGPEWNGKLLSLQIDHINGISDDNRIENLRILCPNCHAQTITFGSKRLKKS